MNDLIVSLIRTMVPAAVGSAIGWAATRGFSFDAASITPVVCTFCISLYYAAARWAEQRWPAAGWLLGMPKAPSYGQ